VNPFGVVPEVLTETTLVVDEPRSRTKIAAWAP
jgi:hypothetical protein